MASFKAAISDVLPFQWEFSVGIQAVLHVIGEQQGWVSL